MTHTEREKTLANILIAQARDAHARARNFASINHKALAFAWRQRRDECLRLARMHMRKA